MHVIEDSRPPRSRESDSVKLLDFVPLTCAKEDHDGMVITTGHPRA